MIVIHKPEVRIEIGLAIIVSKFLIDGKEDELWYKLPKKYGSYLITENSDAFLVGLLFLALKTGNNISVDGLVSARLYYTLNHYLIPALCIANPEFKKVTITANGLNETDLNIGKAAGTGLSCGVDSFATYFEHLEEKQPYAIEYFTFFNVGSHGDFGGKKARKLFNTRFERVQTCAKELGKEIIKVDSNLGEILQMNFQQTHSFRSISCVLLLQKLFMNYYYASAYRLDYFKLNKCDTSDSDIFNLNMLSTESTTFYSGVSSLTRVKRTSFITKFPTTYSFLDVCTSLDSNLKNKNCSECEKCLRTALTLDLLGKLHLYQNVFHVKTYKKNKNLFIGKIITTKKDNPINKEIYDLALNTNNISLIHYYYAFDFRLKTHKKNLKKFIKNLLKLK